MSRAGAWPHVRAATTGDAEAICGICNPFVTGTTVTFEEMPVAADALATRIAALTRTHPWRVAAGADGIAGHAYAGPWRTRAAYRHAAECSLHVAPAHAGRGVGRALYTALCARLREMGWKLGRRIEVGYWQRLL